MTGVDWQYKEMRANICKILGPEYRVDDQSRDRKPSEGALAQGNAEAAVPKMDKGKRAGCISL